MSADRAATIFDVARLAGVSKSTASRVLTGDRRVSAEAVEQVTQAAAQLAYVRNPAARSMTSNSGTRIVIGVVSPRPTLLVDEYLSRVVTTAARLCAPERIGVAIQPLSLTGPDPLAAFAHDSTVHGVILVNSTEAILDAVDRRLAGRVVSIGIGSPLVPFVDVDNYTSALATTRHLIESGRRHIVMLSGPKWLPCTARLTQAYRKVMRDAGLPTRTVVADFTAESGRIGAAKVLQKWPDVNAIFAVSDATAIGVIDELRARHIDVPGDVAVAGFDDIAFAQFSGLTTATHPVEAIAEAATRAVLEASTARPPDMFFSSQLVLRKTA